jgi:ABC-2 type transport system ATP-binding protein
VSAATTGTTGTTGTTAATVTAASAADAAIRAKGLTKRYGSVQALDGLDLDVPAGSIFGLLGPNGAGKTTTIRILTGLAAATAGTASVAGIEVGLDRPDLHRRIGYLDQDPRFYSWMQGRELLELSGRLSGIPSTELRGRVDAMLARTGLTAAARRRIGGWSGGMRQRLGIAQALIHEPAVLFLDEPVSSLDPEGRRDLLDLIEGLRGQTTVVLSTHVLADVERVCDRVAILDRGRLVTEGSLEDLLSTHARPIYRLVLEPHQETAAAALVDRLRAADWTTGVTTEPGGVIRVAVGDAAAAGAGILPIVVTAGVRLAAFERARPTLEEVFLELVGPPAPDDLDGRGFVRPREVTDR